MGDKDTAGVKTQAKRGLSRNTKRNLVAYSFIAPNFIGFAIFTLIPIIFSFALGFFKWNGNGTPKFIGLDNFTKMFGDTFFKASFVNTLMYCIGTVPLTLMAALGLAMLLNKKIKGRGLFRTIAFFPYVASLVAVTAVWSMIFHPSKGPVNALLHYVFNVQNLPNWYGKDLIMFTLVLFSVWRFMGYYMIIYLAGLQGISGELYEAAKLDGAGKWNQFRYITWPQLSATTFFVTVMLTISSFKVYDVAIMLAGGSDGRLGTSSTVLVYYIYQKAFQEWDLGYSSAIAMVLFALVLTITLVQFKGQKKKEKE
ncbi:carbohydrate ABC transporter permease [[Clostridium] fimetarium]|uniref:Multiple sugar transport system permease protein n=1 Tax=[Clostridium] fimetarium TaxID=99656 RepID=A0A1I0NN39_9FIRM|nr:sugar ABC transporter permease [[Clostridium] fimetarium]SEW02769.1 multiple sugar transport system permease protein [[Clostridium] fimetarium]